MRKKEGSSNLKVLGIDEAGRGSVIGPLVIAGALVDESSILRLKKIGVKDSKALTPKKREVLKKKILNLVKDFEIVKFTTKEIDKATKKGKLNLLEAKGMARIIKKLKPKIVYLGAPSINQNGFLMDLKKILKLKLKIVAEKDAEKRFLIVSAASILAKVERDRTIREYQKDYGDFGLGYPSEKKTINFLEDYYQKNKTFPKIVRKEWETIKRIKRKLLCQTKVKTIY